MQLFYREEYRGMTLEYRTAENQEEWGIKIVAYKNNQIRGEGNFNFLNINRDNFYVGTIDEVLKSGRDLVDSLLNHQK